MIDDGANVLWKSKALASYTASQTGTIEAAPGVAQDISANALQLVALPVGLVLLPGYRISTLTAAIQAGDQYSGALLYVVESSLDDVAI